MYYTNLQQTRTIQAVSVFRKQFVPKDVYESRAPEFYVITGIPFPSLKKYTKIPTY